MTIKPRISKEANQIIERGGNVKADRDDDVIEWKAIHFHMPKKTIEEIDDIRKERLRFSRTAWILEAIQEKIKRTNNEK